MREFLGFVLVTVVCLWAVVHLLYYAKEHWCGEDFRPEPVEPVLCDLGGVRCRFLRFYDEDQALFKIDIYARPGEHEALYKRFKETGIVPPGCSIERVRKTWALVELPTGDVFKTEPDSIKFIRPEAVKDEVV